MTLRKVGALALVLGLFAFGCGSAGQNVGSLEAAYDAAQSDDEALPEDLGGPGNIASPDERRELAEIASLKGEAASLERTLSNQSLRPENLTSYVELTRLQTIINAMEWRNRVFSPKYRLDYAGYLTEGQRRFAEYYDEPPQLFKGYIFGGDPTVVDQATRKRIFNELLGADCTRYLWWNHKRAFASSTGYETKVPLLPTEYLFDIALPYVEAKNEGGISLSADALKQLALRKYRQRLSEKRAYLNSQGQTLGQSWESTHLRYFDYFDYVNSSQARAGDYVLKQVSRRSATYQARGHAYLLLDPSAQDNFSAVSAVSGKEGILYHRYEPRMTHVLRPNLKRALEDVILMSVP
ncbi:MAG: hypothetical protein AB1540_03895 [Bdellovibrionota bacterium]